MMERRKAPRFKGQIYFCFRTKSLFSRKESSIISVKDISAGGLCFIYPEALPFGQRLLLNLYLPMYAKPVKVEAEVRKSERLPDGRYKNALQFIKISPDVQKNLSPQTYLANLVRAKEE